MRLGIGLAIVVAIAAGSAIAIRAGAEGRGDRVRLAFLAMSARLIGLAAVSAFSALASRPHLFPDEGTYLREATQQERYSGRYSEFLGRLFDLTGPSAWLPRTINVVAGTLLAVVVYEVVRRLAGKGPARTAGIAVALWPSLILWSTLVLKDTLVLLAIFSAFLAWVRLGAEGRRSAIVMLVAAMAVLERLRPYAFVVTVGALVSALALRPAAWGRRRVTLLALSAVAVGALGLAAGTNVGWLRMLARGVSVEGVDFARTEGSVGETAFATPGAQNLGAVVGGVPRGLFFSLFGPWPWSAEAESRGFLVVELPLWYAALGLAGASQCAKQTRLTWGRLKEWAPLLVFATTIVAVLAVYQGNAGTALRQRAMVIPVVIALASLWFGPTQRWGPKGAGPR